MTDTLSTPSGLDRAQFESDWATWREAQEKKRTDRHGFLAITSLTWLTAEPVRIDGIPGSWSTGPEGPVVDLVGDESLVVDGAEVRGRHAFGIIAERGETIAFHDEIAIEIAKRDGHDIVRPRDPANPFLRVFSGTPTFAADPHWRVAGRFVPFDQPRPVTVGSIVDDLHHVYDAPGIVEFAVDGETFRLTAFEGKTAGSLQVLFTDATSGVTTYPANRSLGIDAPAPDGSATLDFNHAINLACAYTDYATCPLPPAENRLPIGIEAGEKIPLERNSADVS